MCLQEFFDPLIDLGIALVSAIVGGVLALAGTKFSDARREQQNELDAIKRYKANLDLLFCTISANLNYIERIQEQAQALYLDVIGGHKTFPRITESLQYAQLSGITAQLIECGSTNTTIVYAMNAVHRLDIADEQLRLVKGAYEQLDFTKDQPQNSSFRRVLKSLCKVTAITAEHNQKPEDVLYLQLQEIAGNIKRKIEAEDANIQNFHHEHPVTEYIWRRPRTKDALVSDLDELSKRP